MSLTYHATPRGGDSCTGVTLVELLISVAVLGILLGVAAPSFSGLIARTQLVRHVNALSRTLYLARETAVYDERSVVVCKGNHGRCHHDQSWSDGWFAFTDRDHDRRHDSDEPVLLVQQPLTDDTRIALHAFGSTNYIVYRPSGLTRTNGTFTLCEADRRQALVYSKTGRVRVTAGDPEACPPT